MLRQVAHRAHFFYKGPAQNGMSTITQNFGPNKFLFNFIYLNLNCSNDQVNSNEIK